MAKIFTDSDADLSILKDKVIAVIGYGSQGRAWAYNMRDSGLKVIVGLRKGGKSWEEATREGFEVVEIPEAAKKADIIVMLIPDMVQPKVWRDQIGPNLRPGQVICFAHGFTIHFGLIKPPEYVDVVLVAPKGPGSAVRELYLKGFGVPALVAVQQDYSKKALDYALAIAKANGFTRAGAILSSFKEETETDLIGEQCVLVGGVMELIKKAFEVLTELGYQPEVCYFEVLHELKMIVDLIWRGGLTGMLEIVSETAKYGGLTVGPRVIDEHVRENIRKAAQRVISGEFAKEWVEEYEKGCPTLKKLLEEIRRHPIEEIGRKMRELIFREGVQ
ncbi:MAG: ketol-acid reductoisomerase [Crenarchaeota archaeon]|nr:ketol-acid reductoisomerase [Thermoproteota archaeon]